MLLLQEDDYETAEEEYQVLYTDVIQDPEKWRPLLSETRQRLEGKVATAAEVKRETAFFEQVSALAPGWKLAFVQIYRSPKQRRLPARRILEGDDPITHRAAALIDGHGVITVESEAVSQMTNVAGKFDRPIAYAIFMYGEAPASEFGENNERAQPPLTQRQRQAARTPGGVPVPGTPALPAPEDLEVETVPSKEIAFDVDEAMVPKWVQGVLRRLHVNLGHPTNATLVRQLAQTNASQQALIGAKGLRCSVCKQMQNIKPSPVSKMPAGKSFNEQVCADLIYIHDIAGETHTVLSLVDDASHYHTLQQMTDRTAQNVIALMIHGWFKFFGPPELLLLHAEGAMKSFKFEEVAAQTGCAVRFVPADARWQLGRAERHGAVAQETAKKLITQHGAQTAEDIEVVLTMVGFAKNQLIRRAGVSPAQWVFGRSPRIPGSLLSDGQRVEDKHMLAQSQKLQRTELMRQDAMKNFLEIDMSNRLRTAMLRKSRPFRGGFEIGQRLAYRGSGTLWTEKGLLQATGREC